MSQVGLLRVDTDLCDGNGLCAKVAPTLLAMSEEDELTIVKSMIEPHEREQATAAIRVCPKAALSLE
jgi:ferredoxin